MVRRADVVIVGAGVVGCAAADQLTALGCTDVVVLDAGPLPETGGSTSHAPGLVFQTNPSKTMTAFARCSVERYTELGCFEAVSGIEVSTTPERQAELKRRHGLATAWGLESELLPPEGVAARIPILDPATVAGGFHVPSDGIARAVGACEAMAREAGARGARFYAGTPVTGIDVARGHVQAVETPAGRIEAGVVLVCAGIWGPLVGRMAGVPIPLSPVEHQYVHTTPVPALAGETVDVRHPILRHQDRAMYFRQHGDRYGIGSYGHRPLLVEPEAIRGHGESPPMPAVRPFTDADFAQPWLDARTLLPALRETDVDEAMNAMFSFTPDGFPLLGESRAVRGFWTAEAIWITHAVGAAKAVAEWIVSGSPAVDVRECDLQRFEAHVPSRAYVRRRAAQGYDEVYDILHPLQPLAEPRPLRTSPFFARQRELGGFFLEANGWERPHWFEANAPLVDGREIPGRSGWEARYWSPIVGAEALVTRERVALYDMTPLKRAAVTGPGALAYLQRLTTNELDRPPGYVTYTLMLDERGGIKSDITVARLAEDRFQVGCNGPRDLDWLWRQLPGDGSVDVRDVTGGTCCIGLWGPRARDVIQPLSEDDFSNEGFGFFRAREAFVGEVPVVALRLSYVGELGWELYASGEYGPRLWDLLWGAGQAHGVIAGGRGAFNALRLEKGYRMWGVDMWSDHDPYEAGLTFTVKLDKGEFIGREALGRRLELHAAKAASSRLACLTLDEPGRVVMGKEPVFADGRPAGFVTSADYGYTIGCGIAYAWLPEGLAVEGTAVEIEYFAERHPATVRREPLFDPEMIRMRA